MDYIKYILLPGERALMVARMHPILLLPGLAWIAGALFFYLQYHHWFGPSFVVAKAGWWLYNATDSYGLRRILAEVIEWGRHPRADAKLLILIPILIGAKQFMAALILMQFSELVVTDRRILSKVGVMTVTTNEIDRRRIAGVTVHQSFWGRIFNYGTIYLQGFAGGIGHGLPVIVAPHRVQAFVNV